MILKDSVVIITGAGGGLGEGMAHVCRDEGAKIVVAEINEENGKKVADNLGPDAEFVSCDVADDEDLDRLVEATVERFGRIDGLVNNAGVNFAKPFLETTPEEWQRVISVDLRAVFFLTQKVCLQMLKQEPRGGSIVNIASVHTLAALPGAGPYDAAKCGVAGMSKSFAVELATEGIRVNTLSPGLVKTQIWRDIIDAAPDEKSCLDFWKSNIPMGRVIETEEIGQLAAFLLSDRSSCITGSNIIADAGMTSQLISKEPYQSDALEGE